MAGYLLDTTAIIDHLRGKEEITSFLKASGEGGERVGCCCINITETYTGMKKHEEKKTDQFIQSLHYLPVTHEISRLAGRLKNRYAQKGITLGTCDMIIAATAITYRVTLVTANARHYPLSQLKIREM